MTQAEERQVLGDLIQSPGWQLYMGHVTERWGPAALESAIRMALKDCPPEEERALVSRLMDAFAAVRADTQWPSERVRALSEQTGEASGANPLYRAFKRSRQGV